MRTTDDDRRPTLDGRVAIVTGGGSGLGAAIAHRLGGDGATVVVNDVDAAAAEATAGSVGGEAAVFDVGDARAFDDAVDAVVARHGRLDIVVNNAGVTRDRPEVTERLVAQTVAAMSGAPVEPLRSFVTLRDEDFDRVMRTHVYGTFHGMRAALRHMEPVRSGAIVNLCSIYAFGGSAATPDYAAAKHAVAGLTRSAGAEVAPLGIRVNAVAPGFIDTPLLDPMGGLKPLLATRIPAGRLGTADEVAELVRFLAGPEASYCFGEILPMSGGWLA
jgi:NAD(P)-dependent dehydrogenase (short-subunit alcohol dehydrogenase family)